MSPACASIPVEVLDFAAIQTDPSQIASARKVCESCALLDECAAENVWELVGFIGGMSMVERVALRRRLNPKPGPSMLRPVVINHGTDQGYHAHRRKGDDPCTECRAAHAAYKYDWKHRPGRSTRRNAA